MKQTEQDHYETLLKHTKETAHLTGILSLLNWDQETYLPEDATETRSNHIALLSQMIHEKKTDTVFQEKFAKLVNLKTGKIKAETLNKNQKKALELWYKDYEKKTKIPSSLIHRFSQVTSQATKVWAQAKKDNSFKLFAPYLQKIVDLNIEKSEALQYSDHPYDPLLDDFEPGMSIKKIEPIFQRLKQKISKLLNLIREKRQVNSSFLFGNFPTSIQSKLTQDLLDKLSLDSRYARVDTSTHPFCISMHPTDVRFTTRIDSNYFMSHLTAILHEVGHAFYELNLPSEHYGTPICEAISLAIHESQSRLWETIIGGSLYFWEYFYPKIKKHFPKIFSKISLIDFYHAINRVEPTLIRVEADEVTYFMHIYLRFEIEKGLIEQTFKVADIPEIWRAKMKEYLKIEPETDREGCLQDIHWAGGWFGYFPTYALGNLYAAAFFQSFVKEHPTWFHQIAQGKFNSLQKWLQTNIHSHGRFFSADELIKKITQQPLSEKPYIEYLEQKYSKIYNLRF